MGTWTVEVDTEDEHGDILARLERQETDTIVLIREQESPDDEQVLAAYQSYDGGETWEVVGGSGEGDPRRADGVMFRALIGAERYPEIDE